MSTLVPLAGASISLEENTRSPATTTSALPLAVGLMRTCAVSPAR